MPYVVSKEGERSFGIYRQGSSGEPEGRTLGMHSTEDAANDQLRAMYTNEPDASKDSIKTAVRATEYFNGSALKALGDGKIAGYLIAFGKPADKQGEWFSPNVETHIDWYGGTTRPILYHHGLTEQEDIIEEIGALYKLAPDENGWWAEGQLDLTNPRASAVYNDIQHGKIGWSSGSSPHLVKVQTDGCIIEWPIIEASLTPTPAAGKRTTVQALKFDFTSPINPVIADTTPTEPAMATGRRVVKGNKYSKQRSKDTKMSTKADSAMIAALESASLSPDQIIAVLKELAANDEEDGAMMADDVITPPVDTNATMSAEAKDAGPVTEGDAVTISDTGPTPAMTPPRETLSLTGKTMGGFDAKTVASQLREAMASYKTAPAQSKVGSFVGENPARKTSITDMHTPYHDMSAADMALMFQLMQSSKNPRTMSAPFQREMASKAMKAYQSGELKLDNEVARKVAMKVEFNNTGNAADGGSWVPDLWSSILWMRVRIDNNVAKNVEVFQMPSPTFEYPIESTDPTVYAVGESDTDAEQTLATNVFTRSKLTVSKLQFSAKKTGLQVGFSTELEEDSIIPFIPQLRAQSIRAFANSIDYNILNSDNTTGTGNINYKGANTSGAATSNFLFGGGQGMRYNALVTNTNVAVNFQGGVPTLNAIRAARFKMISTTNTYGINPEDLVIITDPYTYGKFLSIDEINVYMNNGRNATVNTGVVPDIDGTPVYPSYELKLTDSTGYVTSTNTNVPSSSVLGNFVIFAKSAWKVGYVRQVMTDVSYIPWNDSYILTMTARYAIGNKDTVSSVVAYNMNVS